MRQIFTSKKNGIAPKDFSWIGVTPDNDIVIGESAQIISDLSISFDRIKAMFKRADISLIPAIRNTSPLSESEDTRQYFLNPKYFDVVIDGDNQFHLQEQGSSYSFIPMNDDFSGIINISILRAKTNHSIHEVFTSECDPL